MASVVGDIAVIVGADVSGLEDGLRNATRDVNRFGSDVDRMATRIAKVGIAITAIGVAAVGAFAVASRAAGEVATEIRNLSAVSGVTAEEFQKLAIAAGSVGIAQDKMADIFKDVNDKFGDFLENGAGPLTDFFENIAPKVGVTADQFARLSGPEALQLYVSSLEQAGVSQQQMTFYMEALASDATALIPIFRNNGEVIKTLGDRATEAGRIIGNDLVESGAAMDRKFKEVSKTIKDQFTASLLENAPELENLAEILSKDILPVALQVALAIGEIAGAIAKFTSKIIGAIRAHEAWKASVRDSDSPEAIEDANVRSGRPTIDETGFEIQDPRGNDVYSGEVNPYATPGTLAQPELPTDVLRTPEADMETRLAGIQEFLAKKQEVVDEANEAERGGARAHAAALEQIEQQSISQRLHGYGTFFGNMAEIARAGGEKTFKVMKAFSAAQALVNSYAAYTEVLKDPALVGQPWLRQAMAVSTLGAGLAQVANIRSASIGGGTGGGAGGAAAVAQPTVSRNVAIELQGETFGRAQVLGLINQINEAVEDGAIVRLA